MDRSKLKSPFVIIAAALGWAFVADPLISHLAQRLEPGHRDLFRSLNDFIVLLVVSLLLYHRISRQAREVRKTRDDYRRLFEEIPVPMFIFDSRDFRFLAVNTAARNHYGYSRAEFLQLKVTDIRPPEEVPAFLAAVQQVPGCYADAGRWLHRKKNGDTFYVRIFSHHIVFEGTPAKQTLVVDIDEKVRTEKALEEKTAELENVLESMTDAFYTVDHDWNFTYINKEYERVQGQNRARLLGKNVWELFPYGKEHRYFEEYDRALREQVSVHFEEFNTFNGMWVSASAYPIKSGLAIYFRDITPEKLMREKSVRDGQNLRAIINNTRDLIWSVDRDFNIITGNGAFWERVEQLTGKRPETISNSDFEQDIMRPILDSYRRAFRGEAFLVIRERELDGHKRFEELSFNPIVDQQQEVTGVNCFLRDITRQREHVEQIEKQNDKLRQIAWIQSHQLRVPVANILGLAEVSRLDCSAKDELIPLFCMEAKRLDELIREITALTQDLDGPG
ncbi:PAS domain-containing protein [Mucilaginibacter sp. FT3.2]|uniref:PAS domain-containing protein n=1 Tax=Mucilaginibacter sp. FT3.2 TaxID=2723090 RepID=UPI00161F2658|nr:PAS domain S-box protein [Mucilaginibacter sp. FT3.2]MBB6234245.1 PAS domain S-box-containing protein [Mucilaginibacter sp. FT3.2]